MYNEKLKEIKSQTEFTEVPKIKSEEKKTK